MLVLIIVYFYSFYACKETKVQFSVNTICFQIFLRKNKLKRTKIKKSELLYTLKSIYLKQIIA